MNSYLMEEFNVASMEEKFGRKFVSLNFNWKTNIGLESGR